MAKTPKIPASIAAHPAAGLQVARAVAKAYIENTTALRRLVERITVIDEGGFTEFLLDGETIVGGTSDNASMVYVREFGRLVDAIKAEPAPKTDAAGPLLVALEWMIEAYREDGTADDKQPEAVKAALDLVREIKGGAGFPSVNDALLKGLKEAHELAEAHGWAPAQRLGWATAIALAERRS